MNILVAVKRVVDDNVKVGVKSDGSGIDSVNVKKSINPFDEIAIRVETSDQLQPLAVAKQLKALIDREQPSLMLGIQAIDDDSNQTGQMGVVA